MASDKRFTGMQECFNLLYGSKSLDAVESKEFCMEKYITEYKGIKLKCQCYLDKGHDGPHICYECSELPLELHQI